MQRIVPVSDCPNGARSVPIFSILPVGDPAERMELPLKTSTLTSLPSLTARPTSIDSSVGCPIRIVEDEGGVNRTRPR